MDNTIYNNLCDALNKYVEERKNHHLEIEIGIAWDDEDEFEHHGYYASIDEAIAALLELKKLEHMDFEN